MRPGRWFAVSVAVLAINAAMQATGKIGGGPRLAGERVSALDYLRMSYYERWFTGFIDRIVTAGLVTSAEIASGRPAQGSAKAVPALPAAEAAAYPLKTPQASRNVPAPQYQSRHPYASSALCPWEAGYDRPRPRRFRLSRHQCPWSWREAAARLFGAVCGARSVGRAGRIAGLGLP